MAKAVRTRSIFLPPKYTMQLLAIVLVILLVYLLSKHLEGYTCVKGSLCDCPDAGTVEMFCPRRTEDELYRAMMGGQAINIGADIY